MSSTRLLLLGAPAVLTLLLLGSPAVGQTEMGTSSAEQRATVSDRTPRQLHQDWLTANGLVDGLNEDRATGQTRFVAFADAIIDGGRADQWVSRRNIAVDKALMNAKAQIADYVGRDLASARSVELIEQMGEDAPPMLQEAARQLSVVDKLHTLADHALDAQIRTFDPAWDGSGRSSAERQQRVVEMQESYREQVSQRARLFVSGALPVNLVEGTNADGKYGVGVTLVWSPITQRIAQAFADPSLMPAPGAGEPPLVQQIEGHLAADPAFLAVSHGVRVWRNPAGERVLVAFSGVDRSNSSMRNDRLASLQAAAMIQQFVAEQVESHDDLNRALTSQTLATGAIEAFNASAFQSRIEARAPNITLAGLAKVYSWQGRHPVSETPMQVDVFAWSPSTQDAAGRLRSVSEGATSAIRGPTGSTRATSDTLYAPSRQGATTNPTDF